MCTKREDLSVDTRAQRGRRVLMRVHKKRVECLCACTKIETSIDARAQRGRRVLMRVHTHTLLHCAGIVYLKIESAKRRHKSCGEVSLSCLHYIETISQAMGRLIPLIMVIAQSGSQILRHRPVNTDGTEAVFSNIVSSMETISGSALRPVFSNILLHGDYFRFGS